MNTMQAIARILKEEVVAKVGIRTLMFRREHGSIVTHDAGATRDSIMPFYTATMPHSYIGWDKTTHLGYGIPLMVGAKLAAPA